MNPRRPSPTNTRAPAITLPSGVIGLKSPYPTVVAVMKARYTASPKFWMTSLSPSSTSQRASDAPSHSSSALGHTIQLSEGLSSVELDAVATSRIVWPTALLLWLGASEALWLVEKGHND